jgi:hypothetical protein
MIGDLFLYYFYAGLVIWFVVLAFFQDDGWDISFSWINPWAFILLVGLWWLHAYHLIRTLCEEIFEEKKSVSYFGSYFKNSVYLSISRFVRDIKSLTNFR